MTSEFSSLGTGEPRQPTWSERDREALLRDQGIADVFVEPSDAPQPFWEAISIASEWHLAANAEGAVGIWEAWAREFRFATGGPEFYRSNGNAYQEIVKTGFYTIGHNYVHPVALGERLAAVELLMDVVEGSSRGDESVFEFAEAINRRARQLRVGVRIDRTRFVPVTSEHLHQEIVQPTLLLLNHTVLSPVDALYRKAFDRVLAGDHSGAITAACSSVEEILRLGLNDQGARLQPLLGKARTTGWIIPAVEQMGVKLDALRAESDAHFPGTDDGRVAMLAIHLAGSMLMHLAQTRDWG